MKRNLSIRKIYFLSWTTALMLGVIFIISLIAFIFTRLDSGISREWVSAVEDNWLIVIFKLHAELISLQGGALTGVKLLDIIVMTVFSFLSFGLYTHLKQKNRLWPLIAFLLSVVAIVLFVITRNAGRSTIMLSVLIFSLVMLKYNQNNKLTVYIGIIGGVFLFAGDLTVGIHSNFITCLFGIGYLLLTTWFFLVYRIFNHKFKMILQDQG